jgi:hypothetical protein
MQFQKFLGSLELAIQGTTRDRTRWDEKGGEGRGGEQQRERKKGKGGEAAELAPKHKSLKVHSDCVRRRTTSLWGSSATPYDVVHVNCMLMPRSLCTVMNINEKKYGLPLAESLRRRTT